MSDVAGETRQVVVRHEHGEGDIPGYHQPVWLGDSVLRDRAGRPHRFGWTRFARVVCNNPGCPYECLVNAEAIVSHLDGDAP